MKGEEDIIIVFDDSSKSRLLNSLGITLNENSQLVDKNTNKILTNSEHEPIENKEFGGILKGSKIAIKKDKAELVRYFVRREECD